MQTNKYAPPQAEVSDRAETPFRHDIDALPVSDRWKHKFRLIEKAGGPAQQDMKALPMGERFRMVMNFLAFLFGPLYYIAKGMWRKAISLFAACFAFVVVAGLLLEFAGLSTIANALGYGAAAFFSTRANVDYYKKMVLGDNGWW